MARNYQTFMLSDEPKIAGIPITTGLPVFLLTAIGLLTGLATTLFIIGAALSVTMHCKFGGLPIRLLLAIVYSTLPRGLTYALFQESPDSSHRQYIR